MFPAVAVESVPTRPRERRFRLNLGAGRGAGTGETRGCLFEACFGALPWFAALRPEFTAGFWVRSAG